ncbi:MAG: hypothetical protein AB7G21_10265 [Dehalococcoidia bacterium]
MHRGSMVAAALSLIGASVALTVTAVSRDVVSMPTAIGIVLLLNAFVRFRLATSDTSDHHR